MADAADNDAPDAVDRLIALLKRANAVVTLDMERSTALPCFDCGTTDQPRDLVKVGVWTRSVGARGSAGDDILRPICPRCRRADDRAVDDRRAGG